MIETILGGLVIFGISEITGEVYHAYHHDNEKDILIKAGNKLADAFESGEKKIDETKENIKINRDFKKATSVKTINKPNSTDTVDNIISTLEARIQKITDEKNADIITAVDQVYLSMIKVCDELKKAKKFDEKTSGELEDLQAKITDTRTKAKAEEITVAKAKTEIKSLMTKLQKFIDLDTVVEEKTEEVKEEKKTTKKNEKKIPNFADQKLKSIEK